MFPGSLRRVLSLPMFAASLLMLLPAFRAEVSSVLGFPDPSPAAAFTGGSDAAPLRWETCSPIEVLVNVGPFGQSAYDEIQSAFSEITEISGHTFSLRPSSAVPSSTWALSTPGSTPPVVVAWVHPDATDLIESASGGTVANPAIRGGVRQIVTGAIALNSEHYQRFRAGTGPGATRRNLLLHEIGHLLGLDHAGGAVLMDPTIGEETVDGFTPVEADALRRLRPSC